MDIDDGEWLAIQGRGGSGKTTVLSLLGGLASPIENAQLLPSPGLVTCFPGRMGAFAAAATSFLRGQGRL